jgi:CDGSH-type Zn-finger protein
MGARLPADHPALAGVIRDLGRPRVLAMTTTASEPVRREIAAALGMHGLPPGCRGYHQRVERTRNEAGRGTAGTDEAGGNETGTVRRRVRIVPGGPILIEGPVELEQEGGETVRSDRFQVAVCTCRRSRTFPLCDTSHRRRVRSRDRSGTPETDGAE